MFEQAGISFVDLSSNQNLPPSPYWQAFFIRWRCFFVFFSSGQYNTLYRSQEASLKPPFPLSLFIVNNSNSVWSMKKYLKRIPYSCRHQVSSSSSSSLSYGFDLKWCNIIYEHIRCSKKKKKSRVLSLSLSLSLSHTHTHTLSLSLSKHTTYAVALQNSGVLVLVKIITGV